MTKLVLLASLLLLLFVSTSRSQSPEGCVPGAIWLAADKGLTGSPIPGTPWSPSSSAVVQDGRLYLLHTAGSVAQGRYIISTWDGQSWHDSLALSITPQNAPIQGIASIGGALHLYGGFAGINGSTAHGMARWNGSAWESVGLPAGSMVVGASEFRGEPYALLVTGTLPDIGYYRDVTVMMRRHVGVWNQLGDFRSGDVRDTGTHLPNPGIIDVMVPSKEGLYVGGWFDSVGGKPMNNMAMWNGSTFTPVGNGSAIEVSSMQALDGRLYAAGEFGAGGPAMAYWDGTSWSSLTKFPFLIDYLQPGILGSHHGMLYSIRLIPGTTPYPYSIVRWNGDSSEQISGLAGQPFGFIEYGAQLFAYGAIESSCGGVINGVARLCDEGCGTANGIVYRDDDGNCTPAPAEPRLRDFIVQIEPGGHVAITNADGIFREPLPADSFTVFPAPRRYWSFCPASRGISMATADAYAEGLAFGAKVAETKQDVAISLACGQTRAGGPLRYAIRYSGVGALPSNGTVRLTLDDRARFVASEPAATRTEGNIIEWDFESLAMLESRDIRIVALTSPSVADSTRLCSSADVAISTANDAFMGDNRDSACVVVNDPHGSNMISSMPGYGDDRIYYLTPTDTTLTYTVVFTNTGSDTARSVTVTDWLGENHDLGSIIPGAASHPYTMSFTGPGAVRFTFRDIALPGGGTGQGFVKFALRVKKSLAPGTLIPNAASIVFDYNPEVTTNVVTSRLILHPGSVPSTSAAGSIGIAPNPAALTTRVTLPVGGGTVTLHDLLGACVQRTTTDAGSIELDLSGLAPGLYLLRATTRGGVAEEPLVIVR
jgi:hypothetical protein